MVDFQDVLFRSVSRWSAFSGLALFLMGVFFALQGFRFARILIALSAAGGVFFVAFALAPLAQLPPEATGGAAGVAVLGVALMKPRFGGWLSAVFIFGALLHFMATRVGLRTDWVNTVGLVGCALGGGMPWIARRSLGLVLTTLLGSGLMLVGFVAATSALLPGLADTFCDWASRFSLVTPVMLLMFFVLGYSVQANAQQGDVMSGGGRGWNDAPVN